MIVCFECFSESYRARNELPLPARHVGPASLKRSNDRVRFGLKAETLRAFVFT